MGDCTPGLLGMLSAFSSSSEAISASATSPLPVALLWVVLHRVREKRQFHVFPRSESSAMKWARAPAFL